MTDTETIADTKTNIIHHILEDILYHKISRIPPIIYFLNSMKSLSQERKLHNLVDYDDDWNSPIHLAVRTKNLIITGLLIKLCMKYNLDVLDSENDEGDTPLSIAVKGNSYDIVFLLLCYGADRYNRSTVNGMTPLEISRSMKLDNISYLLETQEVIITSSNSSSNHSIDRLDVILE